MKFRMAKAQHELNLKPLPLIKNVEDRAFILERYVLDKNMCEQLGKAISIKADLHTIVLVENKISDEGLSKLVTPLVEPRCALDIFRCIKN